MARKYTIGIGLDTFVSDLVSAIDDYYGEGNYTIYYQTTEYLVFKIPTITDKVLRIRFNLIYYHFYYGDEWTSGSTITNETSILTDVYGSLNAPFHFMFSQTLFCFYCVTNYHPSLIFITKLTDDRIVSLALVGDYSSSTSYALGKDLTTGNLVYPYTVQPSRFDLLTENDQMIKFPLYFQTSTGAIMCNSSTGALVYSEDIMLNLSMSSTNLASDNVFSVYYTWKYNNSITFGYNTTTIFIDLDNYLL